jgi:hypothetical protein
MVRAIAALSVPALLLTVAPAAPVPKADPGPQYYHPTVVGDAWEYGEFCKCVVTAVERRRDGLVVTVTRTDIDPKRLSRNTLTQWMSVTDKEITLLGNSGNNPKLFEDPFCILKTPQTPGDSWEDVLGKWTTRVPEKVTVKAGTFLAVPADHIPNLDDATKPTRVTKWFAPRVGLVREVETVGGVVTHNGEMTRFIPGNGTLPDEAR